MVKFVKNNWVLIKKTNYMGYRIKKLKSLKSFLLIMLVFIGVYSFAQTKQHYVLHSTNPSIDLTVYENALENWAKLDEFRLLNERRKIPFFDENGNQSVIVELLSAIELKQRYNKRIPKFIISDKSKARVATFILNPNIQSVTVKYSKK